MNVDVELTQAFIHASPADAARVLEQGTDEAIAEVLALLQAEPAARVLSRMVPLTSARALQATPPQAAAKIARELPLDVAAALLRRLTDSVRERLISDLGTGPRGRALAELSRHDANTAGALMDPMVLAVSVDSTAGEALERVRREPTTALHYVYVVAEHSRLVGVVGQRELMLEAADAPLASIMTPRPEALPSGANCEAILAHPAWQRVYAVPVVDAKDTLLGAIRYETLRRIERELGRGTRAADPRITAAALGELYALGLGGFAEVAASTVRGTRRRGGAQS